MVSVAPFLVHSQWPLFS